LTVILQLFTVGEQPVVRHCGILVSAVVWLSFWEIPSQM